VNGRRRGRRCARSTRSILLFCWLLGVVVVGTGTGCGRASQTEGTDAALLELVGFFQAELDSIRAENGFPGATAAFILPDGRSASVATGVADREANIPMRPDALMLAGSVGKSFVAAVALALVGEGRLNLDAKVATWLGEAAWFPRLPNAEDVTLRMLLNHTSGIPEHYTTDGFARLVSNSLDSTNPQPEECPPPEALVANILDIAPLFPCGEDFSYADTNYLLVGLIIQKVTGLSYNEELRRRFLVPLGLVQTVPADRRRIPGLVPGYLAADNLFNLPEKSLVESVLVLHPGLEWTGGGLASNPRDLVRWAKVLYEGKVLAGSYLEDLLAGGKLVELSGQSVRYGLGVMIQETALGPSYGHGGWFPGYHTIFAYYPKYRIAVAIQVNRDFQSGAKGAIPRLARVVLDNTIK